MHEAAGYVSYRLSSTPAHKPINMCSNFQAIRATRIVACTARCRIVNNEDL